MFCIYKNSADAPVIPKTNDIPSITGNTNLHSVCPVVTTNANGREHRRIVGYLRYI